MASQLKPSRIRRLTASGFVGLFCLCRQAPKGSQHSVSVTILEKGEKQYDHQWLYLCGGAALYGSRSRHAGEKRQGRPAEVLQVCPRGRSLLPHRHAPVHAGRVGYGRDQARIHRSEKQPHLRDDLRDAAPLRHPQGPQARPEDAHRLLQRHLHHYDRLHLRVRADEGNDRHQRLDGPRCSLRQLDRRQRQHGRCSGGARYQRGRHGLRAGHRLDRLFPLGHVPAVGHSARPQVQQVDQGRHQQARRGLLPAGGRGQAQHQAHHLPEPDPPARLRVPRQRHRHQRRQQALCADQLLR